LQEAELVHIPDGYLSPVTCAALYGASVPVWVAASRKVRKVVKSRYVPLVAVAAAYCFLVMMFNIPVPDGTTAHAVGAVLVAVLLGPWAAVVAVSIALAIQALFFGDGGVLAYGANVFNMAVVMPMTGYAVYRLVSNGATLTSRRRALAAGIGGYVGLNLSALCTAVEFGIQPSLFHTADGTPLYAPFHLAQTIPAMALAHLTVAGAVEVALTTGVVAYLQRANLPLLRINHQGVPVDDAAAAADADAVDDGRMPRIRWRAAWAALAVMAVLTPLGLLAPGSAFGEDAPAQLDLARYHLDAVPLGLRTYAGFWHNALFDGYGFAGDRHPQLAYVASAVVGVGVIAMVVGAAMLVACRRQRQPQRPAA
jgi:cobalt/nickel transport system permease protein